MASFVNFSNHPASRWGKEQLEAAQALGEVRDIPFPNVPAIATADEVVAMAKESFSTIMAENPGTVMCQGEFSLTYHVTALLKEQGVKVVVACSDRKVVEQVGPDGQTIKTAEFVFQQFRAV